MTGRGMAGTALGLVLLAASAGAQAHKDTRHGFQFRPPRSFEPVALSPNESRTVAKYQSTKQSTSKGNRYRYNVLRVYFYPNSWIDEGQTREEFLQETMSGLEESHGFCEITKERKTKIAGGPALERYLSPEEQTYDVYHAFIEQEDGLFVFSGNAYKERFDKEVDDFRDAARSFKRIDKEDRTEIQAERDQMDPRERFIQEQISRLPSGWDWMRTERFMLLYNADKDFVKDVGEMMEAMRSIFEKTFPPEDPIEDMFLVRVCDSWQTAGAYGTGDQMSFVFNLINKELVTYETAPHENALVMLRQSAFGQYAFYRFGGLPAHFWYSIGHGDYFGGAKLSSRMSVRGFDDLPGYFALKPTLAKGRRLYEQGRGEDEWCFSSLRDLMTADMDEFFGRFWVHKAQSWALVHMLRETRLPRKEWKRVLPDYLENVLAARLEVARQTMEEAIATAKRNAELRGPDGDDDEKKRPPSEDVEDYFGEADQDEINRLAFEKTFGAWDDDDWSDFEAYYLKYIDKL